MSLGSRASDQQGDFWIATEDLPKSPGHPFYQKLNQLFAKHGFDAWAEEKCRRFYAEVGRPGLAPGIYFRMLLIGYFEGIDSERGIDWRCSDSLSLRAFLGVPIGKATPDHSTLSVTRQRIDVKTHLAVFQWVLKLIGQHGLIRGKTIGVDATTLEANAALRSIVRRDTGETYDAFLTDIAKASGIETPTREDLAKVDKKRKKKGSNKDWKHPHDPDARIAKMKDKRTHLAHKLEHGIDMETGAVLGLTLQGADQGDTSTLPDTIGMVIDRLFELQQDKSSKLKRDQEIVQEIVADKGYHSGETLINVGGIGIRTYIAEPDRGKRNWNNKEEEKAVVLGNRRRIKGKRGRRLMRKRGELIERAFAHELETGGLRRTHLRHHENILKRLLVHIAGFNLGLAMRKLFGFGKPRVMQDLNKTLIYAFWRLWLTVTSQAATKLNLQCQTAMTA